MRVVIQRVSEAAVAVGGEEIGRIGVGYLVLVGFAAGDPRGVVDYMSDKLVGLRLFPDHEGKMNLALPEVGGAILAVSQFTLYGDASKGRRPSFIEAARPEEAIPLYEAFLQALRDRGVPVAHGRFGADMQVSLINDGPVTLILERSTA